MLGVSNPIEEMRALDADEMEEEIEDMYVDDQSDDSEEVKWKMISRMYNSNTSYILDDIN